MASFSPDFKYRELLLTRGVHNKNLSLRTPQLRPIHDAFFNNVARMSSFCLFPSVIATDTLQKQLWRDYAVFTVTGKLTLRRSRFNAITERKIADVIRQLEAAQNKRRMTGKESPDKARMKFGVNEIDEMLSCQYGSNQSMQAILFSVILESYMAFETAAFDSWIVALDYGPSDWCTNVMLKSGEFKKGSNFDPTVLPSSGLPDPRKKFGSFLRDAEKVAFSKLGFIRFWFKTASKGASNTIFKKHPYIHALAAVRNIIAHKAGKADEKYVNAIKDFSELNSAVRNQIIHLDGEIVRKLSNSAIALGQDLITFVDDVITPP